MQHTCILTQICKLKLRPQQRNLEANYEHDRTVPQYDTYALTLIGFTVGQDFLFCRLMENNSVMLGCQGNQIISALFLSRLHLSVAINMVPIRAAASD